MNTLSISQPVPLQGQGCAKCAHEWPIDVKVQKLNTSDSLVVSQVNDNKDAKKKRLRKKLQKWWQKASQENSTKSNQSYVKRAITDATNYAACPDRDYAALISAAIRNSPTGKRSTSGICKDIMKSHEWYRSNRRFGWQEAVAAELMGNPSFQPIVECRKGTIIKNKSVKWQLKRQKEVPTAARSDSTCEPRSQSPVNSPPGVAELPAIPCSKMTVPTKVEYDIKEKIKELDRASFTSASSISPLSIRTASSPPHYSAIQSASSEIGSLASARKGSPASLQLLTENSRSSSPPPKKSSSRISSWMHDTAPWTSYKPSLAETLSEAETFPSPIDSAPTPIQRDEKIQLFDPPIEENSYYECAQQDDNGNSSSSSPTNKQQSTPITTSSPNDASGHQTTQENRGSGKSDENEGFSDDEDGNQGRKRKRFRSSAQKQNKRKFACIYHKYDPATYGVQNRRYLVCAGTGFEYTSELVRHLARNHGEYVCSNCLRSFESEDLCRTHKLECTMRLRCSQEERWAALWRARFPGVPVPQDPYLEVSEKPKLPLLDTGVGFLSVPSGRGHGRSASSCQTTSPSTLNDSTSPSSTSQLHGECSTPATSNGSTNECSTHSTNTLKLMEDRVHHLEKKLQFFEEAISCMLKLMISMETSRQSAESVAAPKTLSAPIFDGKPSQSTRLQPPVTRTLKTKGHCSCGHLSPGNEVSPSSSTASQSDMYSEEVLEGDTVTPDSGEQFLKELQKGMAQSGSGGDISDLIEMSNNDFLNKGNTMVNEPPGDLMDLSPDPDPGCDLAKGIRPLEPSPHLSSSSMELLTGLFP